MKLLPAACSVVLLAFPMLVLAAPPASANVLVVDAGGSGNYTQIQAAVDSAFDGDTILVKSGSYLSFVVGDKALSIVGDAGSDVHVVGAIRARNLAAGKTLVFEHLHAIGAAGNTISCYGLFLSNNQGHVRVDRCDLTGFSSGLDGSHSIELVGCSDVTITRTTSTGGWSGIHYGQWWYVSGAGLHAQSSTVTVYDSTLRGGTGQSANPGDPGIDGGSGGPGCTVSATSLFVSGTSILGGNGGGGGHGVGFGETFSGNGGDGIDLASGSTAVLIDDIVQAGLAGPGGYGEGSLTGDDGQTEYGWWNCTFTHLPGASKHFVSSTPVRENSSMMMSFSGTPGDQVRLLVARTADYQLDLVHEGVNLLASPVRIVNMGLVPASGVLTTQVPAPAIGPNAQAINLQLQARFTDPQGNTVLSGPSSLVILNQTY